MIQKKRSSKKTFRKIFILFLIILASIYGVNKWYEHNINTPINESSFNKIKFEIKEGDTANNVVDNLYKKGLISNKYALKWYIKKNEYENKFKIGSYVLTKSLSPKEIVNELINPTSNESWIVLKEGWDNQDIVNYLASEGFGSKETLDNCLKTCAFDDDILKIRPKDVNSLEGFLFPDSYIVFKNSTPQEIFKKLIDTFELKTKNLVKESQDKQKDFYKVLIMASMIEKEVRNYEDMQIVSGILWKRLEEGIPLGVDATVRYARGYWDGALTYDDLQMDSPYNTRRFLGLPPTPICNPSLNSIKAALNPKETSYYYYITIPETGEVVYSKTLDEHNENVYKYLR